MEQLSSLPSKTLSTDTFLECLFKQRGLVQNLELRAKGTKLRKSRNRGNYVAKEIFVRCSEALLEVFFGMTHVCIYLDKVVNYYSSYLLL